MNHRRLCWLLLNEVHQHLRHLRNTMIRHRRHRLQLSNQLLMAQQQGALH
jgi:hypothetical protein